jgi:hypothetical protein
LHGGNQKSKEASGKDYHLKTEEMLAEWYKTSPKTIRNDPEIAAALDTITKTAGGDDFKNAVLRLEVKLTRKQLDEVAKVEDRDQQKKLVVKVLEACRDFS